MLIHVYGDYGLFARPDLAGDRVSYPVPPFTAVRGMLEAFFWKRESGWLVSRVWVLSPVAYAQLMRNERDGGAPTQRRALVLKSPSYVVSASPTGGAKYLAMAADWLRVGRTRKPLAMGTREFAAYMRPAPPDYLDQARAAAALRPELVVGRMPVRISYAPDGTPLSVEWGDYDYDPATGCYQLARRPL